MKPSVNWDMVSMKFCFEGLMTASAPNSSAVFSLASLKSDTMSFPGFLSFINCRTHAPMVPAPMINTVFLPHHQPLRHCRKPLRMVQRELLCGESCCLEVGIIIFQVQKHILPWRRQR